MRLLLALTVAASVCAIAKPAAGCTCPMYPPDTKLKVLVAQALNESDAVFSGTVIEIVIHQETGTKEVKFVIQDIFKGLDGAEATVECPLEGVGVDCGFPFQVAKSYLVYSSRKQGTLETSRCFRNSRLKQAGREVKILKRLTRSQSEGGIGQNQRADISSNLQAIVRPAKRRL